MSAPVRPLAVLPTATSSPIGSSPAVCYTQFLPPETKADILLLDCGDPRSILYTIHCRMSQNLALPVLDFTCSDTNPVVLARNILLFTLIADNISGKDTQKIWNAFYHLYLDGASCNVIHAQAAKLHKTSWTIKQWNDGDYGSFIRFANVETMMKLREYWDHWANVKNMSKAQKKRFKDKYQCGTNETSSKVAEFAKNRIYPASAAPLWEASEAPLKALLDPYWRTGVTSNDKKLIEASSLPNPTLAYSSNGQVEFVGGSITHPTWGYHMSEAYIRTRGGDRDMENDSAEVALAKAQFAQWGESLRRVLDSRKKGGKLIVRFALASFASLCYALEHCFNLSAGDYMSQWIPSAFFLDSGEYEDRATSAPIIFDVIDTALIADSVGELTVLSFTQPLLAPTATSTLWMPGKTKLNGNEIQPLLHEWHLGLDQYVLGLLLGIIPIGSASGFTSIPNIDEKNFASTVYNQGQSFVRSCETKVWKRLPFLSCASLAMDEHDLASFLYSLFRRMCSMHKERIGLPGYNAVKAQSTPSPRIYTLSVYSQLIQRMLKNMEVDARASLDLLLQIIRTEQSIHDRELTCELASQLHVYGLRKFDDKDEFSGRIEKKEYSRIGEWFDIPELVCVTFNIPYKALRSLEDFTTDDIKKTSFSVEIEVGGKIFTFTSFYSLYATAVNFEFEGVELTELHENEREDSPLTLTFWMPSIIITTHDSDDTWIRLMIDEDTATNEVRTFMDQQFCLYETTFSNQNAVLISLERPNIYRDISSKIEQFRRVSKQPPAIIEPHPHLKNTVHIELDHLQTLKAFSFRWNAPPELTSDPLIFDMDFTVSHAGDAAVADDPVTKDMEPLHFPLPVRKIIPHPECTQDHPWFLAIPARPARFDDEYWIDHFPTRFCELPHFTAWNLHYVPLDSMPVVSAVMTQSVAGLRLHYGASFNSSEISFSDGALKSSKLSGHREFKFNVWTMFESYLGFQGPACSIFCFSNEEESKMHLVLFVTELRLDLTNSTLVLDCCALPVTANVEDRLQQFLNDQVRKGERILYRTSTPGALKAWTDFIPAAAERCRTWPHRKDCSMNSVRNDNPELADPDLLCRCAQGKPSASFSNNKNWQREFGNNVTRIAVSVIFDEEIRKPQCHVDMAIHRSKASYGEPITPVDYFGNGWDTYPSTCKVCGAAVDPAIHQGPNGELMYCSLECEEEDPDREGQIPLLDGTNIPGLDGGAAKKKKKNKKKKKKKAKANDGPDDGDDADNEEGGPHSEVRGINDY